MKIRYKVSCYRPGCREASLLEIDEDKEIELKFCSCGAGLIFERLFWIDDQY
ncbi:MAG: hypothetical protein GY853_16615 [PVC group bacterium]|nr:hypothetical protein [PVC group bacterium]